MTICLRLSDAEAQHLDLLIQAHGSQRAADRRLSERRNLLTRDASSEPPTADKLVALVSVKLKLAQLHNQCERRDAIADGIAALQSCT